MRAHAPQNMNSERYHIRNAAAPFLTGLCPKVARLRCEGVLLLCVPGFAGLEFSFLRLVGLLIQTDTASKAGLY